MSSFLKSYEATEREPVEPTEPIRSHQGELSCRDLRGTFQPLSFPVVFKQKLQELNVQWMVEDVSGCHVPLYLLFFLFYASVMCV